MIQLCFSLNFQGSKVRLGKSVCVCVHTHVYTYTHICLFIQRIFVDCIKCVGPVLSITVATDHMWPLSS